MNYWPAENCGLPELHEPLFDMIREVSVTGEKTAEEIYGAKGFVSHHNVDLWRLSTPVGRKGKGTAGYAFWPMSSGWLCRHLFEHYEYGLDETFLKNTAWPLIRKAAEFYNDVLTENREGWLVFAPSTSPENTYIKDGARGVIAESTAMTMSIIREVFEECIKSARILGEEDAFTKELEEKLPRLKPLQIGADGRVLEWNEELAEAEPGHRHISHVYALYPGNMADCDRTPQLAEAFRKTMEKRGDEGTGWSLGWKVNVWARLQDGDHAFRVLAQQLRFVPLPPFLRENSLQKRKTAITSITAMAGAPIQTCSTLIRPSRSTEISVPQPESRKCSCRARRRKSGSCPLCLPGLRTELSGAFARRGALRSVWNGKTAG